MEVDRPESRTHGRPRNGSKSLVVGVLVVCGLLAAYLSIGAPIVDQVLWRTSIDQFDPTYSVVRQRSASDCGAAALSMILEHFDIARRDLTELTVATSTGRDGTSLLALKRVAEQRGLRSQGLRLTMDGLEGLAMPAIAHVHGHHFVVVRSVGRQVVVDDPAIGRLRMRRATFARAWDGLVLTFGASVLEEAE